MSSGLRVLTIGHSNHSFDDFARLLQQHGVTALADVRSAPFSRFVPQYNRNALQDGLTERGIRYVFLGRELGARTDDRTCYVDGRVQYSRLAKTTAFEAGIDRVMKGARGERIAIMCAEKDPLDCHRTLLVAQALVNHGVAVDHILADGRLEPHHDALLRLLDVWDLRADLFRSDDELIAEALGRQEQRIAYVDRSLLPATAESEPA
jgi:uncharacterized protein (DUF488 family)